MLKDLELPFEQINRLLEPGYLPFESGYMRLSNGYYLVAVLTRMPYCKREMIEWWFAYGLSPKEHTQIYKLWHPIDHLYGAWDDQWKPGHYIGASHIVEETLGGKPPAAKLRIHFQEPSKFYDTSRFEEARATAICAHLFLRNEKIEVEIGRMTHFVRDRDVGCEMRSRFWLNPNYANYEMAKNLFQHCVEEMRNLATILPYLYAITTNK
ncbi:MAG: hypothetical protein QXK93_02730 [Candidatus Bathyarchaeia archaeon]|nr:hypothetical protein [Candidatus Bathyarchaeota archaeon]